MNIEVIGLNHKSAPIEVRERLSFSEASLKKALGVLRGQPEIQEGVILSTCNRVEIYAVGLSRKKMNGALTGFLSSFHGVNETVFERHLYKLSGLSAIRHLFRVISSLDSQVLGENQILGQIKSAYLKAKEAGAASKIFPFIFEEAIKIGKRVRSQTQIGLGAVSISTAAVEMAKKIFAELKGKKILIIGAGKIGELASNYLYGKGIEMVLVANRTFSKAQELANKFKGKAIKFDKLYEALAEVDIVLSSTNAPHFLVTRDKVQELILKRKQRPIFFIDLGLPRNIDAEVNKIDNVYIYNLDDLKKVKDANLKERLKEAEKVEQMIDDHLMKVELRLKELFANAGF